METYERSELGGVGEGVLGGWRITPAAPSQDLLRNTFPSQVCLSREGRESGSAAVAKNQKGFTITSTTITAAASPGTSLIRRKALPDSVRSPAPSFLA